MAETNGQQAAAGAGETGAGQQQAKTLTVEELQKQFDALKAENEKLAKVVSDRNAENKTAREKAEAAERAKAEAEGNVAKLRELDEKRAKELEQKLAELSGKASRVDAVDAVLKRRVEASLAKLPEALRPKFAAMDAVQALDLIDDVLAVTTSAGPGAVKAPQVGSPAGQTKQTNFSQLTPEQIRALPDDKLAEYIASRRG